MIDTTSSPDGEDTSNSSSSNALAPSFGWSTGLVIVLLLTQRLIHQSTDRFLASKLVHIVLAYV